MSFNKDLVQHLLSINEISVNTLFFLFNSVSLKVKSTVSHIRVPHYRSIFVLCKPCCMDRFMVLLWSSYMNFLIPKHFGISASVLACCL